MRMRAMFGFVLFLLIIPACDAFILNGTNYQVPISNMDFAAYNEHSANFNVDYSLVDQYVGWNNTNNYNTTFGFYGAVNFSGYSVGGPFDISIDATSPVTASSSAAASVQLINQNPFFGEDALLEYWVEDQLGNIINTGTGLTIFVGSLTTVTRAVSLTAPSSAGTYVYHARVTWSTTYTAAAYDTFVVTSAPGGGEEGGGGGGGAA